VYNPSTINHMNPLPESDLSRRPNEAEWNRVANSAEFRHLLAVKRIFIIPAFVFFLAYYLMLPVLVGYAPRLMSTRVVGTVTVAYLFALSQFVIGWTIACLYLKASSRFDELVNGVLKQNAFEQEDNPRGAK
jgi:uncharacterized membrane protein (DUF485 family)